MRAMRYGLAISLVIMVLLSGCGQAATPETAETPTEAEAAAPVAPTATTAPEDYPPATPESTEPTAAYPEPTEKVEVTTVRKADGIIQLGEYQHETLIDNFALWWANDADTLYMAMQGPTTGWVAVGLDPENRMQGANMIIGAVVDGAPVIYDAIGLAPVGPNHPEDTAQGGTVDVLAFGGIEQDGQTLIEFQIPLDSGDAYDKPLTPGQTYRVIVATGESDDISSAHTFRGSTEIQLKPAN